MVGGGFNVVASAQEKKGVAPRRGDIEDFKLALEDFKLALLDINFDGSQFSWSNNCVRQFLSIVNGIRHSALSICHI